MRGAFLVAGAVALAAACAASASFIAYDNTINVTASTGFVSGNEWADDLHMISAGQLASFTFKFEQSTSSTVTIRFYPNNATDTLLPVFGSPLAEYVVPVSGGGSSGSRTVDVTGGPVLPADAWMSFEYDGGGQIRLHNPPSVGSSHTNISVLPNADNFNFNWQSNFPFKVELVPTPGAGGILALAALGFMRRRR